ncbi:MAG: hypothetical protein WC791_03720 [Candidatus Paceibacterota bacterium]|jgi:hypothetical protein
MGPEDFAAILRKRVIEFGEKPAYVLSSDELAIGSKYDLLHIEQPPEDRGDGTIITKATFEGKVFLCIKEKK